MYYVYGREARRNARRKVGALHIPFNIRECIRRGSTSPKVVRFTVVYCSLYGYGVHSACELCTVRYFLVCELLMFELLRVTLKNKKKLGHTAGQRNSNEWGFTGLL